MGKLKFISHLNLKFILILTEGITDNDIVQSPEFTQTLVLSKLVKVSVNRQMFTRNGNKLLNQLWLLIKTKIFYHNWTYLNWN